MRAAHGRWPRARRVVRASDLVRCCWFASGGIRSHQPTLSRPVVRVHLDKSAPIVCEQLSCRGRRQGPGPSPYCSFLGLDRGLECAVVDEADCNAAQVCAEQGRCAPGNGSCHAGRDGEAASAACATGMGATVPGTGTAGPSGDVVGSAGETRSASARRPAPRCMRRRVRNAARSLRARPTALIQVASAVELSPGPPRIRGRGLTLSRLVW